MAESINKQAPAGYTEQRINPDTIMPLSLRYGIVTVSLSFAILRYPSLSFVTCPICNNRKGINHAYQSFKIQ